jgi:lambda repressor-like predicted transcriptional regulator
MVPDISVAAPTTIGEAAYYMLVVVVLTFICVVSWKMLVTALHFWKDSAWLAANPGAMFHESGASGNILSRRGGRARNCLTVTVTQDGLSIRPTWLYGLLGGLTYRDFRIPVRRIVSVTENRRFMRRTVAVSYRSGMDLETLELTVRKPFRLVQAIAGATLQESRSRARRRRRVRV